MAIETKELESNVEPTTGEGNRGFSVPKTLRAGENVLWAFGRTSFGRGVLAAAGFASLAVPIVNHEIDKAQNSIGDQVSQSAQAVQHSTLGKDVHNLTDIVQSRDTQETLNNINKYLPELKTVYYGIVQLQKDGIINLSPQSGGGSHERSTHAQEASPATITTTTIPRH